MKVKITLAALALAILGACGSKAVDNSPQVDTSTTTAYPTPPTTSATSQLAATCLIRAQDVFNGVEENIALNKATSASDERGMRNLIYSLRLQQANIDAFLTDCGHLVPGPAAEMRSINEKSKVNTNDMERLVNRIWGY